MKEFELYPYKIKVVSKISDKDNLPVFFIHDGHIFTKSPLDPRIEELDNIMLVAIEPEDRLSDYSPWPEDVFREDYPFMGRGPAYLDFIDSRLRSFLEKEYDIEIRPEKSFLAGSSMGGLISLYGLLERPESFRGAIAISSSLWYDKFLDYIREDGVLLEDSLIYMDVGDREGKGKITLGRDVLSKSHEAYGILLNKSPEKDNISFKVREGMSHRSSFFFQRIYQGIFFMLEKSS